MRIFSLLSLAGLLAVTGCKTPGGNAALQAAVTGGAAITTSLVLQKNPGYRPDFVLGGQIINTLITGTNLISADTVGQVVAAAGEKNPIVITVIDVGVNTANAYISANGTNAIVQQAQIRTVLGWVDTGINEGLGASPPALRAKYHR